MLGQPTFSIDLDKRYKLKSGKYPLKIRINFGFNFSRVMIKLPYNFTEKEWRVIEGKQQKTPNQRKVSDEVELIKQRATHFFSRLSSPEEFNKSTFLEKLSLDLPWAHYLYMKGNPINEIYEDEIAKHTKKEKFKNANGYRSSLNSLLSFHPQIDLSDITVEFLKNYENNCLKKGHSISTVGNYVRYLRAIYNIAINKGLISDQKSPFAGANKYIIPATRKKKEALSNFNIKEFFNYEPPSIAQQKAKDFWFLSYWCHGANFIDIANWRKGYIKGDYLIYRRQKTKESSRGNAHEIKVKITPEISRILSKWGSLSGEDLEYIFPFISPQDKPIETFNRLENIKRNINRRLMIILKDLKISAKITIGNARHSFATQLKRKGFTTEEISEFLAHTSTSTTEHYLASLETERIDSVSQFLSDLS